MSVAKRRAMTIGVDTPLFRGARRCPLEVYVMLKEESRELVKTGWDYVEGCQPLRKDVYITQNVLQFTVIGGVFVTNLPPGVVYVRPALCIAQRRTRG